MSISLVAPVTRELLANPDLYDSEGQPCLIVLKGGCATDLTVGRHAGLESFLCNKHGVESVELAIYNYSKEADPFSAKGDSGSLIFDGLRRMVGLLHSRKSKRGQSLRHVCYPCMVADWSHQGEVSARRLRPQHLVKARTTSLAFFTSLLLMRLVLVSWRSVILWLLFFGADRYFDGWPRL